MGVKWVIGCFLWLGCIGQVVWADSDTLGYSDAVSTESSPSKAFNGADPYEAYNRAMFAFNDAFNQTVMTPVARAYTTVVPQPARTGVSNFIQNLGEPLNMANALMQGNVESGLTSLMRFSLNSTLGLAGLIDIGNAAGLSPQDEDFGQTLYVWGVWDQSNYLILPLLGPTTARGVMGMAVDTQYDPTYPHLLDWQTRQRLGLNVVKAVDTYVTVLPLLQEVQQQPDPYIFMRESFFQNRKNKLYNGQPPLPALDDFNFE